MRKMMKYVGPVLAAGVLAFSLAACSGGGGGAAPAQTQQITDTQGETVEVPTTVEKTADLWHAHNQVVLMLNEGDSLVGTTEIFKSNGWAQAVYPRISDVTTLVIGSGAGEVNYEEMMKLEPDVVFASDPDVTEASRKQGLTTLNVAFQDFDGLRNDVAITGQVFGGEAQQRADDWAKLLDSNIALVAERVGDVPEADRPKVLHICSSASLTMVDGRKTIVDEWINLAGGVNAIEKEGNRIELTMEEIVAADPDVIIIGSATPDAVEALKADPAYQGMKCVQEGRVYANPAGVFSWDRYSGEEALQVLWAAKFFNPDKFEDIDMVQQTQDFYKTFYGYDLSKEDAERMLAGLGPQ